jgi:DNA invertase Pin-like site-specific DNA recombinase
MRAAGYVRVSTVEQQRHGWNIGEDRDRIRERADGEGWELVDLYDDGGRQGDDRERPGLRALFAAVEAGELDVLILRDLDRLSRDRLIYAEAVARFEAAGVAVYEFDRPEPVTFDLASDVRAAVAQDEKRKIGQRVKLARAGRVRAGLVAGGNAPYGYRWEDKTLAIDVARAAVVRRIFADYASGVGQRAIVRALNAEGIPGPTGGAWQQSSISRVLSQPIYRGQIKNGDAFAEGQHEAIIEAELWQRVEAIRNRRTITPERGRRRGKTAGRTPGSPHLLTGGLLRCSCGAAMLPRKARKGIERDRYVCAGRIADPSSCSQASIRRERIDRPLLKALLDSYIDLDGTRQRIAERAGEALTLAREAVEHAQAESAKIERALIATERAFDAGDIDARQYGKREARLTSECDAAQEALRQAQGRVDSIEQTEVSTDAEGVLLQHLATLKRAVGEGVGAAPNLAAMRNVIRDLFAEVEFARNGDGTYVLMPLLRVDQLADGRWDFETAGRRQPLSFAADDTPNPIGQATPVPWSGQYPPGFFARYCWW